MKQKIVFASATAVAGLGVGILTGLFANPVVSLVLTSVLTMISSVYGSGGSCRVSKFPVAVQFRRQRRRLACPRRLFAGAGFALDTATGAMFEQHPSDVFVTLEQV